MLALDDQSLGDLLPCYSSLVRDLTSWVPAEDSQKINGMDTKRRRVHEEKEVEQVEAMNIVAAARGERENSKSK